MIGDDDAHLRENYTCTCKCYSSKGSLYELSKDEFMKLKQQDKPWLAIMEKIIVKESRKIATHIRGQPRDFDKEIKQEEEEKEM